MCRLQTDVFSNYVIVGNADTHPGLHAPFNEEDTTDVATVEMLNPDQEIIECWKRLANTDQFGNRMVEYAELAEPPMLPRTREELDERM